MSLASEFHITHTLTPEDWERMENEMISVNGHTILQEESLKRLLDPMNERLLVFFTFVDLSE